MTGVGRYEFYRWWANAGTVLKDGSFTASVPLQPVLRTSVFGRMGDADPRAFAEAIADLGDGGVTFRILQGSAVFTMNRFAIE